jgi:potassium-dependent mechanosensitive channel
MLDRFSRVWRAWSVAAGIALFIAVWGFVVPGARAQQAAPEPTSAQEAMPEAIAVQEPIGISSEKEVAEFSASLDLWTKQISLLEHTVADDQATDEQLKDVPGQIEALRTEIVEQRDRLRPKLQEAQERLKKLGPTPEEAGPKESPQTALQRQKLGAAVAALDGLMKRADVLLVRADQVTDAANTRRRDRFTESLFRPVPGLFQYVLPAAIEGVPYQVETLVGALGAWIKLAYGKGPLLVLLLLLIPLGGAVVAQRFIRRIVTVRTRRRDGKTAEATPQQRGTAAILKALESCLPLWTALAGFYLIATASELAEPATAGTLAMGCLAIAWARLLLAVVSRSLAPGERSSRVVNIDDDAARGLARLLQTLIAIWLIDQLWGVAATAIFTPHQQTVLRTVAVAALYLAALGALLLQMRRGGALRRQMSKNRLGWVFSLTALLAALIGVALLLGYAELARFLGSHAVSTAGLLWIMYLLHLAAESISSVSVISGRQIEGEAPDEEADAPSLLTIRIIGGLLMDIVIVAVGVTILLVIWRFDWVEVKGWIQAAFFGFQFGDLRISLQSILIALGVFALGLTLTRFVQGWFTKRAFAGRRSDQGLKESVRVGLGYAGFVLAGLAGLSYLGLDFSNLAIVAGALSVGIGFGLQSIFNNFVSGIILLVERPFKIGDWIAVGNHEGMVKKISVRSTEIETIHRQSVIIPNANLITDSVTNWMHGNRTCRLDVAVGVSYETDVRVLRKVLVDVGAAHGAVLKQPAPVVHFAGFGDSSLDFELRVFLRDAGQRVAVASDLRFAIWSALTDAGITIPFPQRDLHIKSTENPASSAPSA